MGMFDYVRVDPSLIPDEEVRGHDFQTKDFGCYLDTYEIAADGTFIRPGGAPSGFFFYTIGPRGGWYEYFAHLDGERVTKIDRVPDRRDDDQSATATTTPE
jgi:hypothetical protein